MTDSKAVPDRAQVVVIGGGVIGCSVAYHLTKLGCRDVLLLERKSIGCGTSWHSLGVVGLLRAGPTLTRLAMETARLLPELERETGKSTGYAPRGSINVTGDPARLTQFRRVADVGRALGLEVEEIDAAEAGRLWPLLNTEGLIGGIHLPTEGQCNPLDLVQAYSAGARQGGATLREQVAVTDIELREDRIVAVQTEAGRVDCEQVVNCTGLWARDFARSKGASLPLQGVEHNYLVTEFIEQVPEGTAILRDPDIRLTVREDARQLSVGFNEEVAKLFGTDGIPEDFSFEQLPPDWDAAMPYFEQAMRRVPVLREAGIRLFLCGPESVTPDIRYLLGPVPGFANYFVAAGFSGVGIGSSGGAGRALAEWVLQGQPSGDLWELDIRRMMPFQANRSYLESRATEAQGKLFAMAWPHRQYQTGRGIRRSPVHSALREAGACFGSVAGWEVPDWFAPAGSEPKHHDSFERPDWFPHAQAEARAAMEAVGLADRSQIAKFLVLGSGSEAALSAICAKDPAIALGGHVLTPLLNASGGIEALMRVIRLTDSEFLLLSEPATQQRDLDLLRRRLSEHSDVSLVDVTSAYALFEVMGPEAEEALLAADWRVSADGSAATEIGHAKALVFEEKGLAVPVWSLVVPTELAAGLWEHLRESGATLGARAVGRHARHFVRTLSRMPVWSQAVASDVSPAEAGLDGLVDLEGDRSFVGRAVCERQRRDGVRRRLAAFTLEDPDEVLLGHEPIVRNGRLVGAIEQAAYALASTGAIGLGLVAAEPRAGFDRRGYEIQVAGRRVQARFEGLVAHRVDWDSSGAAPQAAEA